jgi:glycosyltransferase involved in cell wall biosynthesis
MSSRADLHIHSRYSDRSAEWLARRCGLPDSYSKPRELYDKLRARGMQFVTITDHNRIEGCLEIADLPGAFLGEQVTTYFPEDRCKVHLLVWGLTEIQHAEIADARENIFHLQRYLDEQQLTHAVAHPLYRLDDKSTVSHFEKLLLLFKHFEGLNGLRDALLSDITRFIVAGLTPAKIEELANRHGIVPTHPEPWNKVLIAGSDDHSGVFPASAWTETAACNSAVEFLAEVRDGRCGMQGAGGTPLALSHGLYNTGFAFLGDKLLKRNSKGADLIGKMFSRFMEGRDPTEFSFAEKMGFLAQGILSGQIFELAKPANASVWAQLSRYFSESDVKALVAQQTAGVVEPERRAFIIANQFASQLAFRFFTQFITELSSGNIIQSIQHVSTLTPILLLLSPYIYAFQSQSPSRNWLRDACTRVPGCIPGTLQNTRRAWFTDTLEDVNGVATTIRKMTASAVDAGHDLTVVTSRTEIHITGIPIKNFAPIGEFELPEYELQKLSFPPILEVLDYIQREKFTEIIISTPGPIGITALMAARMLGLRTTGIYHTDFPQYVRILTDDTFLETLTWNYMSWFYSQLDLFYVNSEQYRRAWIDRGFAEEKVKILPRGLDTHLFTPSRRSEEVRREFGARPDQVILLYVGRISKEKDLDVLVAADRHLKDRGLDALLVLVGDGPYAAELKQLLPDARFTGYRSGASLADAFASADIFVFPSTTDTFGNVILEAQASGLPCVVSNLGGPRELVRDGETGFITTALDASAFATAIERLIRDAEMRAAMGARARAAVAERDWSAAARQFWSLSPL